MADTQQQLWVLSLFGYIMNLVVQDMARSMPACHYSMKSENIFFTVHHVKLLQHSWSFFEDFLCHDRSYAGEKADCLTPAEDWHIFHIKSDAYLFCCTETANAALQNSKLHLSKITLNVWHRGCEWSISVTNGLKSLEIYNHCSQTV